MTSKYKLKNLNEYYILKKSELNGCNSNSFSVGLERQKVESRKIFSKFQIPRSLRFPQSYFTHTEVGVSGSRKQEKHVPCFPIFVL